MRILTVLGARPQFIKAAALSRRLRARATEILVHSGQHYDANMSAQFFQELAIPAPDHNLEVGSGPHGQQTGAILAGVERLLLEHRPDVVLVYGDTNSTLAGALAAAKLGIRVAHVEAGLRSFNRAMPEELNRILTDHLATWCFAPSEGARGHLAAEGIHQGVHVVGDIMLDGLRDALDAAGPSAPFLAPLGLEVGGFYLATLHRAENTDDPDRLRSLFQGLAELELPVVLPLHPRTRTRMAHFGIPAPANVRLLEPQGYRAMLHLLRSAAAVLTDSGGVQKEAYYVGTPCVTLRDETEWTETVAVGWNRLVGADPGALVRAARWRPAPDQARPDLYGDGRAADRIVDILTQEGA